MDQCPEFAKKPLYKGLFAGVAIILLAACIWISILAGTDGDWDMIREALHNAMEQQEAESVPVDAGPSLEDQMNEIQQQINAFTNQIQESTLIEQHNALVQDYKCLDTFSEGKFDLAVSRFQHSGPETNARFAADEDYIHIQELLEVDFNDIDASWDEVEFQQRKENARLALDTFEDDIKNKIPAERHYIQNPATYDAFYQENEFSANQERRDIYQQEIDSLKAELEDLKNPARELSGGQMMSIKETPEESDVSMDTNANSATGNWVFIGTTTLASVGIGINCWKNNQQYDTLRNKRRKAWNTLVVLVVLLAIAGAFAFGMYGLNVENQNQFFLNTTRYVAYATFGLLFIMSIGAPFLGHAIIENDESQQVEHSEVTMSSTDDRMATSPMSGTEDYGKEESGTSQSPISSDARSQLSMDELSMDDTLSRSSTRVTTESERFPDPVTGRLRRLLDATTA